MHNSTSAGNLCVGTVVESSRTFEYVTVLRSGPPTNSLAEVNSARAIIFYLNFIKIDKYYLITKTRFC
ncbi:MAG: hypothetical protein PV337_01460 [Rickettsiaceae bacterium]|nr:hypothetical protein [Rickettsiaceae bacterium]